MTSPILIILPDGALYVGPYGFMALVVSHLSAHCTDCVIMVFCLLLIVL